MAVDESFKKAGAVPFKWEIRPGVPKHSQQQQKQQRCSLPIPPEQLKPPPAGPFFLPPPEPRTRSFRSAPRSRSERRRFDQPVLVGQEFVSAGCFPSPLLKRKESKRILKTRTESEPDYTSDLEILSRWSVSTRKSLSPFRGSPFSSSFSSSSGLSPRPARDSDWAGFGLF